MPAQLRRRSGRNRQEDESAGSESDSDSGQRTTASKRELPTLKGKDNYDHWWQKVKNYFYKRGRKWDTMLEQAMDRDATEDDDPNPSEDENDTKHRRAAWGVIIDSLSTEEAKKYRDIEQGRVESLIRKIRATHQKKSNIALNALTRQAQSLTLNEYPDLEAYIAEANIIFASLEAQGETLPDHRKTFYLLEGLPGDYEQARSTIMLPERSDTYKQVCDYLQTWLESHPNCPGFSTTIKNKRKRSRQHERVLYTKDQKPTHERTQKNSKPLCRNFQKTGKCAHGSNCRFRHEKPPHEREQRQESSKREGRARKCYNCGSEHHLIANCPKKKKRESPRRSPRIKDKNVQRAFTAFLDSYKQLDGKYDDSSDSTPKKRKTKKKSKSKDNHSANWVFTSYVHARVYKAIQSEGAAMRRRTVIDGGSTCSITTDFKDCIDIKPCQETITVGGKKGNNKLQCDWKGTRVLRQRNTNGDLERIFIKDTRIMPHFGTKVLPEHPFLRNNCRIVKDGEGDKISMEIRDKSTETVVLRATMDDCGLFFLDHSDENNTRDVCDFAFNDDNNMLLLALNDSNSKSDDSIADSDEEIAAISKDSDAAEEESEDCCAADDESDDSDDAAASASSDAADEEESEDCCATDDESDDSDDAAASTSSDAASECDDSAATASSDAARACEDDLPSRRYEDDERSPYDEDHCYVARRYNSARTNDELVLLWHKKLGHRNANDVVRQVNMWGIPLKFPSKPIYCEACIQGKSTKKPTPHTLPPRERAPRRGYLLHSDTCGPFTTPTRGGGYKYFNIIVDDYSGRIWLRLLKHLSDFHEHLVDVLNEIEAEVGSTRVVARFHADGARYFVDKRVKDTLKRHGGRLTTSPPYTPNKNAVAERTIRTVCEMARTMMIDANAPASMWGEALSYAVYLLNHLPYLAGETATRMSLWHGAAPPSKPDWRFIPWGTVVWAHIHTENDLRGKAISNSKARKCVFLGIDEQSSSLRLGALPHLKRVHSAHIVSKEDEFAWANDEYDEPALERTEFVIDNAQCEQGARLDEDELPEEAGGALAITRGRRAWTPSAAALENLAASKPVAPSYGDKSLITMYAVSDLTFATELEPEPKTWNEAMRGKDRDAWIASGKSEFESQASNGTWGNLMAVQELKRSTPDVRIIRAGDVLKAKRDGRKKTRTVLRGYMMEPGIHFNETFAPVVHITTLRVLIALGTKLDWEMKQGDVPTAFQQSDIDTDIWAYPSEAYRHFSKELQKMERKHGKGKVAVKVAKSLPGIPQGSYLWNVHLHKLLVKLGFRRSEVDRGLYVHTKYQLYYLVWVDDIFPFYPKHVSAQAERIWRQLKRDTGVGDMQEISDCLGCTIKRDRAKRITYLSQRKAIKALQDRLKMETSNGPGAPMDPATKLSRDDCPTAEEAAEPKRKAEQTRYRSAVASLIYFSMWTRSDIAYAVGALARLMHNPSDQAQTALKRLLRYVFATADQGLVYDFSGKPKPEWDTIYGYFDASLGDCPDTKRSTGGHCLYWFGCLVAWVSKLHPYVTTSTNHSEYVAGAACARECAFQGHLAVELGMKRPVFKLWSDSKGAISQTNNPTQRAATKHIEISDHYIREQSDMGRLEVNYVPTTEMVADIFTKPLVKATFLKHREKLTGTCPE